MIFFDTETTGLIKNAALELPKQPHIIEIGALREPEVPGKATELSLIFCVPVKLEPIITKLTGLTDEDLEDQDTFEENYETIEGFFEGEDTMIAHNMPFDYGMLLFELRRLGCENSFPMPITRIDTVQMARKFYGGKFKKLIDLYEERIGPYEQKHRALDDCKLLQAVYHDLMARES